METIHLEKDVELSPTEVGEDQVYKSSKQEAFAKALLRVVESGSFQIQFHWLILDMEEIFSLSGFEVPKSPAWPDPFYPKECVIYPIESASTGVSLGAIALGISPTRPFTSSYNNFLKLVAAQTAALIGNARQDKSFYRCLHIIRAHEEERKKREILAELDRAKTTFFR